jgi:hypothetical protein
VNSSLHSFAGFLPKCCCHSLGINPWRQHRTSSARGSTILAFTM